MSIYLLSQTVNRDCNTYDSCVVIAEDEESARKMHPNNAVWKHFRWVHIETDHEFSHQMLSESWVDDIKDVTVKMIGMAGGRDFDGKPSLVKPCVVCASFNAG